MSAAERRAAARTAVVWDDLAEVLADAGDVVDIGGGTGGFAVPVAERGLRVTVVDPSPDALAALARRAAEAGVADRVVGRQGDIADLAGMVGGGSVDLVLCHGVLDVLADPVEALARIYDVLRPGGALSLIVAQRHAAVVARAMAGHFGQALALLDGDEPDPGRGVRRRFTADEVVGLLGDAGFTPGQPRGVRVFADLVPGSLLDLEAGSTQALIDLETAVARRPEFLPLATQVHVVATR